MIRRAALGALLATTLSCGARTALSDQPYEPASLFCTTSAFAGRPMRDVALAVGLPRALRGRATWVVGESVPGSTPTVAHQGGDRATFRADLEGTYAVRVSVPATTPDGGAGDGGTDDVVSCTLTVRVNAAGPVALCPAEVTVPPLQAVPLTGRASGDRPIRSQRWSIDQAPAASSRREPTPDDQAATRFTPDVAGDHRLRFRVTDDNGASDECFTVVHAVPTEGLRVELSWDPPGRSCPTREGAACDGSDVDLHLLQGVGDPNWNTDNDCYYANCRGGTGAGLRWGTAAADDDPRLDVDDIEGHGPENINILRPSARYYRIGVHYFADDGAGPQAATLTVYCNGATPVARLGPVNLVVRGRIEENDLWLAADVLPLPGGGCRVQPIARAGQPWITTLFAASRGPNPPPP